MENGELTEQARAARRKQNLVFALFHAGAVLLAAAFFLYVKATQANWFGPIHCLFHDLFHVYCPSCGGTRAVQALLRLDLLESFRCLPIVPLGAVAGLALYVRAWVAWGRREPKLLFLPKWLAWSFVILYVGFGLVRTLLLVVWKIDLLGDFYP